MAAQGPLLGPPCERGGRGSSSVCQFRGMHPVSVRDRRETAELTNWGSGSVENDEPVDLRVVLTGSGIPDVYSRRTTRVVLDYPDRSALGDATC